MYFRLPIVLLAVLIGTCGPNGLCQESELLGPSREAIVRSGIQAFMENVARDVTREGPIAWCRYFDNRPEFFMAVNGKLAFPNGADAQDGTQRFARTIHSIELKWGNDLRVDPLTPELAVVGVSWREVQVDNANHRVEEAGYFTGLVQYQKDRWKLRDAHWSEALAQAIP